MYVNGRPGGESIEQLKQVGLQRLGRLEDGLAGIRSDLAELCGRRTAARSEGRHEQLKAEVQSLRPACEELARVENLARLAAEQGAKLAIGCEALQRVQRSREDTTKDLSMNDGDLAQQAELDRRRQERMDRLEAELQRLLPLEEQLPQAREELIAAEAKATMAREELAIAQQLVARAAAGGLPDAEAELKRSMELERVRGELTIADTELQRRQDELDAVRGELLEARERCEELQCREPAAAEELTVLLQAERQRAEQLEDELQRLRPMERLLAETTGELRLATEESKRSHQELEVAQVKLSQLSGAEVEWAELRAELARAREELARRAADEPLSLPDDLVDDIPVEDDEMPLDVAEEPGGLMAATRSAVAAAVALAAGPTGPEGELARAREELARAEADRAKLREDRARAAAAAAFLAEVELQDAVAAHSFPAIADEVDVSAAPASADMWQSWPAASAQEAAPATAIGRTPGADGAPASAWGPLASSGAVPPQGRGAAVPAARVGAGGHSTSSGGSSASSSSGSGRSTSSKQEAQEIGSDSEDSISPSQSASQANSPRDDGTGNANAGSTQRNDAGRPSGPPQRSARPSHGQQGRSATSVPSWQQQQLDPRGGKDGAGSAPAAAWNEGAASRGVSGAQPALASAPDAARPSLPDSRRDSSQSNSSHFWTAPFPKGSPMEPQASPTSITTVVYSPTGFSPLNPFAVPGNPAATGFSPHNPFTTA